MSNQSPAHSLVHLVTFTTNMLSELTYRYTDHDRDVSRGGKLYQSSALAISLEKQSGRMEDEPIEITCSYLQPLIDFINYPSHAPIDVEISVINPEESETALEEPVWRGRIKEVVMHPEQKHGIIRVIVSGPKFYAENRPLGLSCNSECAWKFGGNNCRINVEALLVEGFVSAIDGTALTVVGADAQADTYFRRGYVQLGGLKLLITEHSGNTLTTTKAAPPVWLNQTVRIYPGCSKSLSECRNKWNNEIRFGGFGYAIPDTNVLL